jgi:hypothetical protein
MKMKPAVRCDLLFYSTESVKNSASESLHLCTMLQIAEE